MMITGTLAFNNCSYCQREYGTISIRNQPIFKTFDHINALHRKTKKNSGILSHGIKSEEEGLNLIECCNECNNIKDNLTIKQFKILINNGKKTRSNQKYLTKELIKNINNSIKVLLTVKPLPILLESLTIYPIL